jgi:uroporphyrinogen decarboxylase
MGRTPREKILAILEKRNDDGVAFWTGNPHADTYAAYLDRIGGSEKEDLFRHLGDECRWIPADNAYRHPEGKPLFDPYQGAPRESLTQPGCFAECESVEEIERFPWPDPSYLDFTEVIAEIDAHSSHGVFTGMWSPFFHHVADFFGMDTYFVKMYTNPVVVEAVTEKVVDFFVEANIRFFTALGDRADTFFFGNDFGTQRDLILSPEAFGRFVLPSLRRLIDTAKRFGKKVIIHSCGSIYRVIPQLLDAGIDGLHPLQARARFMDAEYLSRNYRDHLAFIGGVDTQELLIHMTPTQIKEEVRRLRGLFGRNYIVSPSHEAILPNVPFENVVAMSDTAHEPN